jgi:hypothetical protein
MPRGTGMSTTRRRKRIGPASQAAFGVIDFLRLRLTTPDPRSHAEFLRDMRAKQVAGKLANPATAALLDRMERAI